MAKIEYVDQRLSLWAEWIARGRVGMGGMLAMFKGERSDDQPQATIPLNEEECWRTDEAVKALPEPLRETVVAYYLSGSFAARDRLHISSAVLSQRIDRAHKVLHDAWAPKVMSADSLPRSFTP